MTTIHRAHVDLNLLLALEALLEEEHVTRAARRLGVTQPAMSHALKRLRELLNDPLFVRTPRGIVPTPRAQALSEPLLRSLAELRALIADAPFDPASSQRRFTIGCSDVGQLVILPPLLERVRAAAPGVRILSMPRPSNYLELLASGELDILIGGERGLPPQLRKQALATTKLVVIGRADHPLLHETLTIEQFAALPHIDISFRGGLGASVDEALRQAGLAPQFMLSMNDLVTAMFVVAKTDLVVLAGDLVARSFCELLPLRAVPVPVASTLTLSQIWHERHQADPAHTWFRTCVREAATDAMA